MNTEKNICKFQGRIYILVVCMTYKLSSNIKIFTLLIQVKSFITLQNNIQTAKNKQGKFLIQCNKCCRV